MATEIKVLRWCDRCAAAEMRAEAEERAFGLNGKQYKIDLCAACNEVVLAPLVDLVAELKLRPEKQEAAARVSATSPEGIMAQSVNSGVRRGRPPASGEREHQCLWCPLNFGGAASLTTHLQRVHGFADSTDAYGGQCPACGKTGFQMMGMHAARIHPETPSASQLFSFAEEHGDPYGVVAARLAAGQNVQAA